MRLRLAFPQPVQRRGFGGEELRWHGMAGPADPWPEARVHPVNSRLSEQRDACDRRPLSPLLARSWRRRDRPRHLHQQGPLPALVQLVDLCHRRGRERRRDLQPGCPPNPHDVAGQNRNPIRHPGVGPVAIKGRVAGQGLRQPGPDRVRTSPEADAVAPLNDLDQEHGGGLSTGAASTRITGEGCSVPAR